MKRRIRINERDLHKVIKESVKLVLKESEEDDLPYMQCLKLLENAMDIMNNVEDDGTSRKGRIIDAINHAISVCEQAGVNGRMGYFDSENGFRGVPEGAIEYCRY